MQTLQSPGMKPLTDLVLGRRASGASDCPMSREHAVAFKSPISLAVEMMLPNCGMVRGLGIRCGVTLIVGGGFHGKSTLLKAIEAGIYNKVRSSLAPPVEPWLQAADMTAADAS